MVVGSEVTFTALAKSIFGHLGLPASNVAPDTMLSFRVALLSITVGEEVAADLEDLFETANSLKAEVFIILFHSLTVVGQCKNSD